MTSFKAIDLESRSRQTDKYKDKTVRMTGKDRAKENQQGTKKIIKRMKIIIPDNISIIRP